MKKLDILKFSLGSILAAAISAVTLPLLTWFVELEDIGRYSLIQVITSLSILVFTLGLDQAYLREYYAASDRPSLLKSVILPSNIFTCFVIATIVISDASFSELVLSFNSYKIDLLIILLVFLMIFVRFAQIIFRAKNQGGYYSATQVIPKVIFLTIIPYAYYSGGQLSIETLVLFLTIAAFVTGFFCFAVVNLDLREALASRLLNSNQLSLYRYSLPLVFSGLSFWMLLSTDRVMLKFLSDLKQLGLYAVVFQIAGAAIVLKAVFSTVWAPYIFQKDVNGIDEKVYQKLVDISTISISLLWSICGVLAWCITFLLPETYNKVYLLLPAMLSYPMLVAMSEVTGVGITLKRRTVLLIVPSIVAFSLNSILGFILIPDFGARGASVSSAIAFYVFFVIKTEFSSVIWHSVKRRRLHASMIIMVLISCFVTFSELDGPSVSILYLCLIVVIYFVHRREVVRLLARNRSLANK